MGIPPPWNDFHLLHVQVLIRQTGTPDVYSSVRQRLIPPILQFSFQNLQRITHVSPMSSATVACHPYRLTRLAEATREHTTSPIVS